MAGEAAVVFSRFGLGLRPGDIERFGADAVAAIEAELDRPGISAVAATDLTGSADALRQIRAEATARREGQSGLPQVRAEQRFYRAEIAARIAQIEAAEIGFVERLVWFWANHFAVEAGSGPQERGLVGSFEREAIRPFVLGNFRDMLGAVTKHPAMLTYLDNVSSFGPSSVAGVRGGRGLNENHARELLELHTIGVDAGYSQSDVTSLAKALTGWSIGRPSDPEFGGFTFRPAVHEPGSQTVLGVSYAGSDETQGERILDDLAVHPATAQHIATKLARHFYSDEPDPAAIAAIAATFSATNGDLRAVARALLHLDGAFAPPTKLRSPQEFVWAGLRAVGARVELPQVANWLRALGQVPWDPPSPAGFKDDEATWLAADAMTNRLDVAQILAGMAAPDLDGTGLARTILGDGASVATIEAIDGAEDRRQALTLLLMSPEFQRR